MNGDQPAPKESLLVVTHRDAGDPVIEQEHHNHGDANAHAMEVAKKLHGTGAITAVYRRLASFDAEIVVKMRKDGEG